MIELKNPGGRGTGWLYLKILMMSVMLACSACRSFPEKTFSIQEQYDLSTARSTSMSNQLEFFLRLDTDHVQFDHDIYFTATFTNTTAQPLVFREPQQYGVIEAVYPETTLLFVVEPVKVDTQFDYPFEGGGPDKLVCPPVERGEFIRLPPHEAHETRLKLPRLVFRNGKIGDVITLPPGQYLVHMTYTNDYIGYEIKRGEETRYIDVGAWVGKVESNPVSLTVTAP